MRKILIIANLRHASPRISETAKYFRCYGWDPTVITPQMSDKQSLAIFSKLNPELSIVETRGYWLKDASNPSRSQSVNKCFNKNPLFRISYKLLRFFYLKIVKNTLWYLDGEQGWTSYALKTAYSLHDAEKFDLILSSSSPVSTHLIANKLKKDLEIPWVADFRDPWTQNHNYSFNNSRKKKEAALEKKTISICDAILTVSEPWKYTIGNYHGKLKSSYFITNGYDAEVFKAINKPENESLIIAYTGQIYPKYQNIRIFLAALEELLSDNAIDKDNICFRYFGESHSHVKQQITSQINEISTIEASLSRNESYRIQKNANVLLLLNWDDPEEKGVVPTKLFEYIGAGNTILATGGSGDDFVSSIIHSTGVGYYCQTVEETKQALIHLYSAFTAGNNVTVERKEIEIEKYSYENLAKDFVDIFDNLVK